MGYFFYYPIKGWITVQNLKGIVIYKHFDIIRIFKILNPDVMENTSEMIVEVFANCFTI